MRKGTTGSKTENAKGRGESGKRKSDALQTDDDLQSIGGCTTVAEERESRQVPRERKRERERGVDALDEKEAERQKARGGAARRFIAPLHRGSRCVWISSVAGKYSDG